MRAGDALQPIICLGGLRLIDWLKCCFTSTETVGLLGTGAQDGHLDFHTVPELWSAVAGEEEISL